MFNTPILYIIFNRLDTVKQTFPKIKEQKPKQLFIAADGPRVDRVGEFNKCKEVRDWVLNQIDWECDLHTLFRDENLGCGKGPAEAITWFFDNVEQGIILEDDCLPVKSFFNYCEELLIKYKDSNEIGMISGRNSCNTSCSNKNISYDYTTGGGIWGWATWKKIVANYAPFSSYYENKTVLKKIQLFTKDKNESQFVYERAKFHSQKSFDAWDYQWGVYLKSNFLCAITPTKNLISNIGFSNDSTHFSDSNKTDILSYEQEFPLIHPSKIKINYKLSKELAKTCTPQKDFLFKRVIRKTKNLIKAILYKLGVIK
jgi:hypothetical protein